MLIRYFDVFFVSSYARDRITEKSGSIKSLTKVGITKVIIRIRKRERERITITSQSQSQQRVMACDGRQTDRQCIYI